MAGLLRPACPARAVPVHRKAIFYRSSSLKGHHTKKRRPFNSYILTAIYCCCCCCCCCCCWPTPPSLQLLPFFSVNRTLSSFRASLCPSPLPSPAHIAYYLSYISSVTMNAEQFRAAAHSAIDQGGCSLTLPLATTFGPPTTTNPPPSRRGHLLTTQCSRRSDRLL